MTKEKDKKDNFTMMKVPHVLNTIVDASKQKNIFKVTKHKLFPGMEVKNDKPPVFRIDEASLITAVDVAIKQNG